MKVKLLNIYIAKNFLMRFLQTSLGFSLLIFFINLLDAFDKIKETHAPFYIAAAMAFLQIPDFLNDVIPSLVLISALLTFFLLSSKSEITVIRMSGFSLWQILLPVATSSLILGIFWITIFGPIAVQMSHGFHVIEGKYVKSDMREAVTPQNGVWLKQANLERRGEEIIIQAQSVYKDDLELSNVTLWFFDQEGQFYKKIDAKKMLMGSGNWLLSAAIVNDSKMLNKAVDSMLVPTNLQTDFIMQKIVNNFQNVKLFTVFQLPQLIADLHSAGFNSTKFSVYFHSLISKPLLFLAMTFIACYFGLNHIRNNNALLMIFLGITSGLALYIISSIINVLGSSGLVPVFAATWVVAIVCLAIGVLLIYQKEHV